MSIKINLHKSHRQFADGKEFVEVDGSTVGECMEELVRQFPQLEEELFDKKNTLKHVVEIYLNGASAYPNEMARKVKDGDEIHLTLMLSGG